MRKLIVVLVLAALAVPAMADIFGTGANQFTIDFVPISGATNPTSGYGNVNNDYRMGTYEVSTDQWNKFKAAYGAVNGSEPAYHQNPYFHGLTVPNNGVSWYEAAQFVNYLNTSTNHQAAYNFTGTQGTSDYTLGVWQSGDVGFSVSNPYRNCNAYYFLPTEDEWVKAAYWNGTSIQTYATKAGDTLFQGNGTNGGWNYVRNIKQQEPWAVTSGSQELNGTYNMMGNVFEWMESPYLGGYLPGSIRGIRGGSNRTNGGANYLVSSYRSGIDLYYEYADVGFRVASVPEPKTMFMLGVGAMVLRRNRKLWRTE